MTGMAERNKKRPVAAPASGHPFAFLPLSFGAGGDAIC